MHELLAWSVDPRFAGLALVNVSALALANPCVITVNCYDQALDALAKNEITALARHLRQLCFPHPSVTQAYRNAAAVNIPAKKAHISERGGRTNSTRGVGGSRRGPMRARGVIQPPAPNISCSLRGSPVILLTLRGSSSVPTVPMSGLPPLSWALARNSIVNPPSALTSNLLIPCLCARSIATLSEMSEPDGLEDFFGVLV